MATHHNYLVDFFLKKTKRSKYALKAIIERLETMIAQKESIRRKLEVTIRKLKAKLAAARDALDTLD